MKEKKDNDSFSSLDEGIFVPNEFKSGSKMSISQRQVNSSTLKNNQNNWPPESVLKQFNSSNQEKYLTDSEPIFTSPTNFEQDLKDFTNISDTNGSISEENKGNSLNNNLLSNCESKLLSNEREIKEIKVLFLN